MRAVVEAGKTEPIAIAEPVWCICLSLSPSIWIYHFGFLLLPARCSQLCPENCSPASTDIVMGGFSLVTTCSFAQIVLADEGTGVCWLCRSTFSRRRANRTTGRKTTPCIWTSYRACRCRAASSATSCSPSSCWTPMSAGALRELVHRWPRRSRQLLGGRLEPKHRVRHRRVDNADLLLLRRPGAPLPPVMLGGRHQLGLRWPRVPRPRHGRGGNLFAVEVTPQPFDRPCHFQGCSMGPFSRISIVSDPRIVVHSRVFDETTGDSVTVKELKVLRSPELLLAISATAFICFV
jgi:hypothetical protein